MRLAEIEAWTLRVVGAVSRGVRPEDDRVECKAEWPDPKKAARRIAGHANQAAADDILWIIGLDEKKGVQPLSSTDFGGWWAKVETEFEGIGPVPQPLLVLTPNDAEVYAIAFDTRRIPFVVRNATGEAGITYEVPWRHATLIRSAKRAELLSMLVPVVATPDVTVLGAHLQTRAAQGKHPPFADLTVNIYITPRTDQRLVFPFHRCSAEMVLGDSSLGPYQGQHVILLAPWNTTTQETTEPNAANARVMFTRRPASLTMSSTSRELIADGPGYADLRTTFHTDEIHELVATATITAVLGTVGTRSPLALTLLFHGPKVFNGIGSWTFVPTPDMP